LYLADLPRAFPKAFPRAFYTFFSTLLCSAGLDLVTTLPAQAGCFPQINTRRAKQTGSPIHGTEGLSALRLPTQAAESHAPASEVSAHSDNESMPCNGHCATKVADFARSCALKGRCGDAATEPLASHRVLQ
jgi:hypothetical protein